MSYYRWKFYMAGRGIFDLFAPVTLTLTRWPSYINLTRIPSRYTGYMCKYELLKVKAFVSYCRSRHSLRSNFHIIFGYPVFLAVFGTLPMSIPVLSQNESFSVFRIFRALPVPLAKFYYEMSTFHQISHTFGFGVADPSPHRR